jgi:glutamate-1-semialdehyde 2,1-aminomutase
MKNEQFIINEGYESSNYFFDSGVGSKIILNRKSFLDLSGCNGTLLLGHNSKIFRRSIIKAIQKKISPLSMPNTQALEYANYLKKIITFKDKFIFCNSGTEAIIKSLRICFSLSKKKLILSATGSWHGSVDNLLFFPDKNLKPQPISEGILNEHKKNLKFIPYNDIEKSKQIILKFKNKINCIIVEPIQGCLPTEDSKKYLKFLRNISKKNKILLIFDELITGLRTDASTLQNYFNIKPDISTFGKCFGGGMPIGIIGITKNIYQKINAKQKKVFFGGTFSANSLSTFVGLETTKFIYKNKKKIFFKINKNAKFFQTEMNKYFQSKKIQARIFRFKSLLRIVFTDKKVINRPQRDFLENNKTQKIQAIRQFLFKNKIYYPRNGLIFFSYQTSITDIKNLIKILKIAFKKFY